MQIKKRKSICMRNEDRIERKWVFELGFALFLILYLSFILKTGYWSDDRKYEFIHGVLQCNGESIFQYISHKIIAHISSDGRFFPVTSAIAEGFPFLMTLKSYKLFLMVVVISAVYLFRRFIKDFTGTEVFANLSVIFAVILFSVQNGMPHVVFLCMGGNAIFCLIFLLLSLEMCIVSTKRKQKLDIYISLLWFILAMLTYEVAYPFILAYPFIFMYLGYDRKQTIKRMVPYVLGLFVMFMVYLFMRNFAKSEYSGITLSLDITKIVRGFLVSITAPLPGVTFLFRGGAAISLNGFLRNIQLLDIIIVLIYIYLCLYLFKIRDKDSFKDSGRIEIFILGSLFVCGPAGLMAVSEKYQALPWGNGYLVIIFQYFGWGCIAAWTIMKVLQVHPHIIRYIFMFCIIAGGSGLILLNQQDIRWTIREKEIQEPSTSAGFDRSLRAAVMSGMASRAGIDPDKDLILMQDEFYNGYARSSVFAEMTGRVYQCMRISEIQSIDTGGREVYVLTNGEGWVIIGHVERLDTLDTKAIVDKLWIYCDNNSDRLLIRSKDDFKFWDLYAANHIENLGQGTLFLFDQITEDAISMEPVVYQTYRLGTRFQFTDTQMNKGVYWKNSLPERERKYTWTDGKKNGMKMELEMAEHFQKIKAEMDIVMVYGNGQQVNINVNGERVFSQRVDHAGKIEFEFAKPANNHVEIDFEFPDAESPLEQGESNDSRELAIAVGEMVLEAID